MQITSVLVYSLDAAKYSKRCLRTAPSHRIRVNPNVL
jgi:hypothetical protein